MPERTEYDAVVVGAGPNGLAAAIRIAQAGHSVRVIEANETVGGGCRSAELTLPGYVHDLGSSIHPMAAASPFFHSLDLGKHGLEWIHPTYPVAHPLDRGRAVVLMRSLEETGIRLGEKAAYERLFEPVLRSWDEFIQEVLKPIVHFPKKPLLLAKFGMDALQSGSGLARRKFRHEDARALFAGVAAHSLLSLEAPASAAIGLVLSAAGHAVGWPMPRGGAQAIADALVSKLTELGGEIETGRRVERVGDLPRSRAVLFDLTPRQILRILRDQLPGGYRRTLERFRYGPGVFKIDYAMREPIPWEAAECGQAGTVHVGGSLEEIVLSERTVSQGRHPERPYVLLAEHSRFDGSRAPDGKHTLWAYCHVPHGSTVDMTERIEAQIERFAPGFRDCVLERRSTNTVELERLNANLIGGDINGGRPSLKQLVSRPAPRLVPYKLPIPEMYVCSASTPPGGGVHGMCGYNAAEVAIREVFR